MLRIATDRITIDHFEGRRTDDRDFVGFSRGHLDTRQMLRDRRAKLFGPGLAAKVVWIDDRRHAGNGFDRLRRGFCGAGDR